MQTIAERLKLAHIAIKEAASAANRDFHSVQLLAVSKTKPVSDIRLAYEAGQRQFGENYVQEGVDKINQLKALNDIEWHMIGPLQSNKTKPVAEHFDWVQSIDRTKIADRLNMQRPVELPQLNVCVQINIDSESSKSGVAYKDAMTLLKHVDALPRLCLRGLMSIPKAKPDTEQQAQSFEKLASLFDEAKKLFPQFDTLSLGMSQDLCPAITHGSTMVRLGTAIFGSRQKTA